MAEPVSFREIGTHMTNTSVPVENSVEQLQLELRRVRQQSLIAMRKGDFRAVARFSSEAARLNRLLLEADDQRKAVETDPEPS